MSASTTVTVNVGSSVLIGNKKPTIPGLPTVESPNVADRSKVYVVEFGLTAFIVSPFVNVPLTFSM